jgi:hypothetical protein
MVSCGDLRLLHVFRVVWLGVPTFGGAIVGNSFFLIELRLLRSLYSPVRLSSSCSLASRVCKCTISLVWPVFPLYIEGIIISLNLLGEASLVVINALKLVEYASFSFINSQFVPFFPNGHFFLFRPLAPFPVRCTFFGASYISAMTFP